MSGAEIPFCSTCEFTARLSRNERTVAGLGPTRLLASSAFGPTVLESEDQITAKF